MTLTAFLGGLAAGLLLAALLLVLVAAVVAVVAWRFARALERAGIDVHLKSDEVKQIGGN